jgi:hypothetical protein
VRRPPRSWRVVALAVWMRSVQSPRASCHSGGLLGSNPKVASVRRASRVPMQRARATELVRSHCPERAKDHVLPGRGVVRASGRPDCQRPSRHRKACAASRTSLAPHASPAGPPRGLRTRACAVESPAGGKDRPDQSEQATVLSANLSLNQETMPPTCENHWRPQTYP